jgi:hypothetical protein
VLTGGELNDRAVTSDEIRDSKRYKERCGIRRDKKKNAGGEIRDEKRTKSGLEIQIKRWLGFLFICI